MGEFLSNKTLTVLFTDTLKMCMRLLCGLFADEKKPYDQFYCLIGTAWLSVRRSATRLTIITWTYTTIPTLWTGKPMFYRSVLVENIEKHRELVSMVLISAQKNKNTHNFLVYFRPKMKRENQKCWSTVFKMCTPYKLKIYRNLVVKSFRPWKQYKDNWQQVQILLG